MIKAVLLPLFLVAITLWVLWLGGWPDRDRLIKRVKPLAITILALLPIVILWALPLSIKYEKPTLGSSGQYSMSFVGPNAIGHPTVNGLIPPSNQVAVTPWEDPTTHEYVVWSPLDSLADLGYYADKVLTGNVPAVIAVLSNLSPLLLGVLWVIILLLVLGKIDRRHRAPLIALSLLSIILIAIYMASHVAGGRRYLWPAFLLSNISIGILLGCWALYAPRFTRRWALWLTAAVLPVLVFVSHYPALFLNKDQSNASVKKLSALVDAKTESRASFASNNFGVSTAVSYYANLAGYGTTQPGLSLNDPLVQEALRKNGVEYYLLIERPNQPTDLSGFNVVLESELALSDPPYGFPPGTYKTYLIRLK